MSCCASPPIAAQSHATRAAKRQLAELHLHRLCHPLPAPPPSSADLRKPSPLGHSHTAPPTQRTEKWGRLPQHGEPPLNPKPAISHLTNLLSFPRLPTRTQPTTRRILSMRTEPPKTQNTQKKNPHACRKFTKPSISHKETSITGAEIPNRDLKSQNWRHRIGTRMFTLMSARSTIVSTAGRHASMKLLLSMRFAEHRVCEVRNPPSAAVTRSSSCARALLFPWSIQGIDFGVHIYQCGWPEGRLFGVEGTFHVTNPSKTFSQT